MTDYTSEKFEILPDSMKRVIRHIFNLADAAAESEEKRIESEQESTKGFIDIVNKKKENVKRLADVVARDYDIQIVESKLEDLSKILERYDYGYANHLETFKAEAEKHNVPLKGLMQYAFIFKNGNKKQKADANKRADEKGGIKLDDIYMEVMSGVLAKMAGGGWGYENDNKDT
jgi:urate oxidase